MALLPDGEKILKICLFVLTEFTNVSDTHTHPYSRAHRYWDVRMKRTLLGSWVHYRPYWDFH